MGVHLDLDDVVANQPEAAKELQELRSERDQFRFLLDYALKEMANYSVMNKAGKTIKLHMEGTKPIEPVGWLVINADGARSFFADYDEARAYADWAHGPRPVHPVYSVGGAR